jgi:hypothetical protein
MEVTLLDLFCKLEITMPVIQHKNKRLLYLHVPKTGGSSIEAWLETLAPLQFRSVGVPTALRCTPQHFRMADFNALFTPGFFDHAVMTVRNPYDRIASEYRMRAVLGGKGFWQAFPSFSLWLETTLEQAARNPFHLDNHIRPQWQFTGTGVEVLRFEDGLPAIIGRIAELLNVPPPDEIPRIYDTSGSGIDVVWDLSDRLLVQDFYAKDFTLFGY